MTISDGASRTDRGFWAIRNSMLPASLEMERAASLLDAAAEMILADRDEEAAALIGQADIKSLFDVREQACRAPPIFSVHRVREVTNLMPRITKEQRAPPFKSESPIGEAVFRRDGWRCRYCGCRVIPSRVRRWMDRRLSGAIRWSQSTNLGCHAGFWTLWGSIDHVTPRSRGGSNDAENLVTACMVCNFAREDFTLEQLGLADPRNRPPLLDEWDGLTRLSTDVTRRTSLTHKQRWMLPSHSGHEPANEAVVVSERSKSAPRMPLLSPADYFAKFAAHLPDSAQVFQVFLENLDDVGVEAEFIRSAVLRFSVGEGELVSAGSILTSGRMFCADAYYYARKHGRCDIGERYLAAIAGLTGGEVRSAGRDVPEVFGPDGRQVNIAFLLQNSDLWKIAIANFVRDMQAAAQS